MRQVGALVTGLSLKGHFSRVRESRKSFWKCSGTIP